jgi:hypothetical protein
VATTNGAGAAAAESVSEAQKNVARPYTADSPTSAKSDPYSLGKRGTLEAKRPETKPARKLEWQQVNSATWQLVDPDGPKTETPRCHGHWPGFLTPKALAYVFDVGVNEHDWRVRVRRPGNRWRAWGCIIDFATAKHIAQQVVENPTEPRPSKFNIPLSLIGGHRWPGAPTLDSQTRGYIQHVEIGAVKVDGPNKKPTASGDAESINLCAADDVWRDWPPDEGAA